MPSMKNENPTLLASPSALKSYFLASRPKTWIASLSPVLIGTAMSSKFDLQIFFLTLSFSLLIQIGTNFANDYFDFINGADSPQRVGPKRATQEGWITPSAMKLATCIVFAAALLAAFPLMIKAGIWSLFVAATCIALGVLYTGGPKPLGYMGLGEILVFIFFGPVATCGTYFLQTGIVTLPVFIASLAPGFLSCALLVANNLRDETSDRAANKRTLVARFGRKFGSWEFVVLIEAATAIPVILVIFFSAPFYLLAASLISPAASPWLKKAFDFQNPLELISVLQTTSLLLSIYTLLFCSAFTL